MNCRTHEHRHFERTLRSWDSIPGPLLAEGRIYLKDCSVFDRHHRRRRRLFDEETGGDWSITSERVGCTTRKKEERRVGGGEFTSPPPSLSLSLSFATSQNVNTFTFILRLSKCERVECNRDSSGALLNTSSPMYYTIVVNTCLSYSLGARALVPVDVSDIILFVI